MNPSQTPQPVSAPPGSQPPYPGTGSAPAPPTHSPPKVNPNSTQNNLQIAEIRDGLAIMNDGTFRVAIMCKAINFDLMSPKEKESVEFAYQGMLNSLYFPIQIYMRSQKVDIKPYLQKLDKIRTQQDNMLLGLLMEDYIAFLGDISQQTNIMDKNFFVIIQYPDPDEEDIKSTIEQSKNFFKGGAGLFGSGKNKVQRVVVDENTLENAKTELRNRVQATMQALIETGVPSMPLDTQELIELYYDVYNPDTATWQQLKSFDDLSAEVVTKGVGSVPTPTLDGGSSL